MLIYTASNYGKWSDGILEYWSVVVRENSDASWQEWKNGREVKICFSSDLWRSHACRQAAFGSAVLRSR